MKPRSIPTMTTTRGRGLPRPGPLRPRLAAFKPPTWEAEPKTARVNMRLPQPLIDAVKARAAERGIPYQRLIREAIERAVRSVATPRPSPASRPQDR